jgi:hypothetical protein
MGKVEAVPAPYMEVKLRLKIEMSVNVNSGKSIKGCTGWAKLKMKINGRNYMFNP